MSLNFVTYLITELRSCDVTRNKFIVNMALSGGRVQRFSSKKALELILGDSCSSDDELTDTDAASSDFLPSENVSE